MKTKWLAAALALLMLSGCGGPRPAGDALPSTDSGAPAGAASEAVSQPASSAASAAGVSVHWAVEPTIEAANIDVLRLDRGGSDPMDYNAYAMHRDGGLCVITDGRYYGLIDYTGSLVVPMTYTDICCGYKGQYALQDEAENWYLLDEAGSLTPADETVYVEVLGTAPNRQVYWVPERDSLYLNGGADSYLETPYSAAGPCAAQVVTAIEYDCAVAWDGYVLTDGTRPVADTRYAGAGAFSCGVIPVRQDGKWGYVDASGQQVLPFAYDAGWDQANAGLSEDYMLPYSASYGTIVVSQGDQDALYDTQGNCLIDFGEYEALRPVWQDMLWACQDGKWGVLQLDAPLSAAQTA